MTLLYGISRDLVWGRFPEPAWWHLDFPPLGLYAPELGEWKNVECVILERYSLGRVKKSDPYDNGDGSENTDDGEIWLCNPILAALGLNLLKLLIWFNFQFEKSEDEDDITRLQ